MRHSQRSPKQLERTDPGLGSHLRSVARFLLSNSQSWWGLVPPVEEKKQDIVISTQTHIKSLLRKCSHTTSQNVMKTKVVISTCLPERRPESLDRVAWMMVFLPFLSESGRCFWWRGLSRWLVLPVSQHPKSKCRIYLKEEKRALCIRLLNTWPPPRFRLGLGSRFPHI